MRVHKRHVGSGGVVGLGPHIGFLGGCAANAVVGQSGEGGRGRGGGGVPFEYRGRGGLGTCENWNGERWCGENLAPILKCHRKKIGTNPQMVAPEHAQTVTGGCYFLRAFGWSRCHFSQLLNGCLDGCSYVPEAVGHNGTVHAKSTTSDAYKMASDMKTTRHNLAHFCCAKSCRSKFRLFLNPPPSPPPPRYAVDRAQDPGCRARSHTRVCGGSMPPTPPGGSNKGGSGQGVV